MSFSSTGGQTVRKVVPSIGGTTPKSILARLDRISVWSLPFMFIGIIGTGFLFAFYDVFDINVSFIQSCVALKHGCTPTNAVTALRVPVVLNLAGYVIGALLLAPISDRTGRRNMLLRAATAARWISVIFIMSSLGALLGIWLGLFLTTSPAPWPHGLSFAQASPSFTDGWRWMYGVGALLAALGVLLRLELPESARWLVGQGRLDEAGKIVSDTEVIAAKQGPLPPVPDDVPTDHATPERRLAFRALLSEPLYVRRMVQLLGVWFLAYVTVFGFSSGVTSMLASLKYPPPEAGLITAVGAFGFMACALFAVAFADRIERKLWLPIGAVITVIGGVIGVLVIAPQIPSMTVLEAMLVVSGFLVLAAIVAQFSPNTRGRYYEEISP
jgi:MFS transporter, putative metabolite:H+ symporter